MSICIRNSCSGHELNIYIYIYKAMIVIVLMQVLKDHLSFTPLVVVSVAQVLKDHLSFTPEKLN
jgi:hypothetical protein